MGTGFAQWAGGVRNRMANDPGRADFKDQVQCHGYLFLHEYLDDVLNGPRPENVIELTKTPGRNKTASKRTRAANVSVQKSKPAIPLSFPTSPTDKENVSAPAPSAPQSKGPSRFQHALFTARDEQDDAPHTRDSISRATPNRPGVPVFGSSSKLQSTPVAAPTPSDDPLSPFRDAESPKGITPKQIFTAQLIIQPSSPVAEPVEPVQEVPTTAALEPEPEAAEVDLSVIQEDDEGVSINMFEDARSDFSRPSTETKRPTSDEEADITEAVMEDKPASQPQQIEHIEIAPAAPPADVLPEPTKAPSSPVKAVPAAETVLAPKKSLSPIKAASPTKQQLAPAQIPPSPPASEDAPALSPKKSTPSEEQPEPVSAVSVPEPIAEPTPSKPEPAPPVDSAPPSTASQPTPPPEPEHVEPAPRPLPIPPPMSRTNSQNQIQPQSQAQAQPRPPLPPLPQAQPQPPQSRASAAPRSAFTGPSLKELRREPSVSGAAHRELRQSSWRKKPEGAPNAAAVPTATSAPAPPVAAVTAEPEQSRLKRKSEGLGRPGTSKLQRMRSPSRFSSSTSSSPSRSSSEEEETELQVPLKDEDSGSGWSSGGGSMLEDLRHRLARLEKSTSGKTPAASRTWTSSTATSTSVLGTSSGGGRMSLSDLSLKSKPSSDNAEPEPERGTLATLQDEVLALGLSTDAARASIRSTRTTTPDNSPPQPKARVLPAPPVFSLPPPAPALVPAPAPVQPTLSFPPPAPVFSQPSTSTESSTTSDAVRANARAEAARFFAGTKVALPALSRTETQSTVASDIDSIFDRALSQTQTQTQDTATSIFDLEGGDLIDLDGDEDLDVDVDGEGEDEEMEESKTTSSSRATSLATSTTQTRSMAKKGPVKSIQLAAAAAKKAAEEQDRKTTRMREMEERRQAAALRKAEEDKTKSLELEKKRKDREELAASKSAKPTIKKPQEDANKKRKVEAEKKPVESKKPAGSSLLKEPSMTKSRIAKPTASTSQSGAGPSSLKPALKASHTNPFAAPAPPGNKTIKHVGSASSLKASAVGKKGAKASISDAPGQALQAQMQARVQAQLKAAQKEPEVQSESIELPDINSEYSDSEDEDRGKDFPEWTQSPELKQALKDQETFNPDAIFGPIQPLKMGDLFKTGHSRFRKRTSSANWAGTDGITVEEEIEYARRMGYKN